MPWVRAWSDDDVSKHVDNLHLAVVNKHPRDAAVAFREEDHVYFVKVGDTWLKLKTSVSGVYSRFFEHFDDRNAAASVARKRKTDRNSPYYWLIQSCSDVHDEDAVAKVVREAWKMTGERASRLGTLCHLAMEMYANNVASKQIEDADARVDVDDVYATPLVLAAKGWLDARMKEGWHPYRTEWSIFGLFCHNEMQNELENDFENDFENEYVKRHDSIVAGQTDLLLRHDDGRFWLVDYKFCGSKKLDKELGPFGKWGLDPLKEVPDNSYGHYLAQQSIYSFILKRRYDVRVSRSSLLHVPTDETPVRPRLLDLELLPDDVVLQMLVA
jgi:ATP-dependent exoDNAse (exonuclease V) beta subunit